MSVGEGAEGEERALRDSTLSGEPEWLHTGLDPMTLRSPTELKPRARH